MTKVASRISAHWSGKRLMIRGRLCILGEHTDWAGEYRDTNVEVGLGMTIVCATNQGLHARCSKYSPFSLLYEKHAHGEVVIFKHVLDFNGLKQVAEQGGFFSYIAGTAAIILKKYDISDKLREYGIRIDNYSTSLPMGKGLSSSAAVCVMVATCFNKIFDLGMIMTDIMELAYEGEMMTPSRCGRMDQCVAMGPGRIALMEFDSNKCDLRVIYNAASFFFVVADLNASKDTIKILRSLNDCFPVANDPIQEGMHSLVVKNQDISWRAIHCIETGNVQGLAAAMKDFQALFDAYAVPVCPSQLAAPRLRYILGHPEVQRLSLAGKGVGSQGDGSVQFLCESEESQSQLIRLLDELGCEAFSLTVQPSADDRPKLMSTRMTKAIIIADQPLPSVEKNTSYNGVSSNALIACGLRDILVLSPVDIDLESNTSPASPTSSAAAKVALGTTAPVAAEPKIKSLSIQSAEYTPQSLVTLLTESSHSDDEAPSPVPDAVLVFRHEFQAEALNELACRNLRPFIREASSYLLTAKELNQAGLSAYTSRTVLGVMELGNASERSQMITLQDTGEDGLPNLSVYSVLEVDSQCSDSRRCVVEAIVAPLSFITGILDSDDWHESLQNEERLHLFDILVTIILQLQGGSAVSYRLDS